jgi:hypothetical protein
VQAAEATPLIRPVLVLFAASTLLVLAAPGVVADPLEDLFVCIPENPEPCQCFADFPRACIHDPEPCKVGDQYVC